MSCAGPFTALISQPGPLVAVLEISEEATRPLPANAVTAFMLANTVAFDDVNDVFVSSRAAEQPFDRTLVTIEYHHDDGWRFGFGWPLPDTVLLFDIMLISAHWKVVMGAANAAAAITMPQLAVFFLDVIIETANKRDPSRIKRRVDLETATNVWEDLARKLADLGKLPATGLHSTRQLRFAEWALERAGLLAAPESGLSPKIAEAFLDGLRRAVGNEWPSVAVRLQEARLARAAYVLSHAKEELRLKRRGLTLEGPQLLDQIDREYPDSPWKRLVEETAPPVRGETKAEP